MTQLQGITGYLGLMFLLLAMAGNPGLAVAGGVLLGQASTQPGTQAGSSSRAGLVIQFDDGRAETRCVSFEGDEISGANLLAQSDLEAIVDASSGMGVTVCQIAGQGCAYPAEPCFCQCMGGGECAYWNYFFLEQGEREWTYSALGAAMRKVQPGSVEAWVWGDGHTPPAVSLTFEEICVPEAPPTALPTAEPTAMPTASPATPAPLPDATVSSPPPTQVPTVLPTATVPQPSPSPIPTAGGGQNLTSYLPFVLAVAGLALIGAVVWLRRR